MPEPVGVVVSRLASRAWIPNVAMAATMDAVVVSVLLILTPSGAWIYVLSAVLMGFLTLLLVGNASSAGANLRKAGEVLGDLPGLEVVEAHFFRPTIVGTTYLRVGEPPVFVAFSGEESFEAGIPCVVQAEVSDLTHGQLTDFLDNIALWENPRIGGRMPMAEFEATPGKELAFSMTAGWSDDEPESPGETRARLLAGIESLFEIRAALVGRGAMDVRVRDAGPWRIMGWCRHCLRFRDEPIEEGSRDCAECGATVLAVLVRR